MIDTVNLHPPGFGPRANPLLFGVSEGLLRLFPLPLADRPPITGHDATLDADPHAAPEPALPAAEA